MFRHERFDRFANPDRRTEVWFRLGLYENHGEVKNMAHFPTVIETFDVELFISYLVHCVEIFLDTSVSLTHQTDPRHVDF